MQAPHHIQNGMGDSGVNGPMVQNMVHAVKQSSVKGKCCVFYAIVCFCIWWEYERIGFLIRAWVCGEAERDIYTCMPNQPRPSTEER